MTAWTRLRIASYLEALSWLFLIPASILKRTHGYADPVAVTGAIHGGLFIVFVLAAVDFGVRKTRMRMDYWVYAAIASVIPLGTLAFDRWVARRRAVPGTASTAPS